MTNFWRCAAAAAFILGALAGCASPQYPINANQTPGSGTLSAPTPKYPITSSPQPAAGVPAASGAAAPDQVSGPPAAAPVAPVESQALPPAAGAPAAAQAGAPAAAQAGEPATPPPQSTPAPQATPTPDASGSPGPSAAGAPPSPAAVATTTPAAASGAEPAITPRLVTHDQSSPAPASGAPVREAYATPSVRFSGERDAVAGKVVDADGDIFENYEVQKGDHIDALARSFATTRTVLLDANHIRPPYVIHPGQIMKVPVAKAYMADSGDTLTGIARRFSVEVGELAQLNHLSERAPLRDGQEIGLPSSMRDKGPLRGYAAPTQYAQATPRETAPSYVTPPTHPGLTPLYPSTQVTADRGASYQVAPPAVASQAPGPSDTEISVAAKGRFVWPVRGDIVARFGPTGVGRRNDGVDIRASQGSAVMAAAPGEVVYAGDQVPGFGNLVLIKHADGWVTAYAHLDQVSVQMKEQVAQGQQVGSVGTTGGAAEPELHFEVRYAPTPADKARPVDPVLVLPQG